MFKNRSFQKTILVLAILSVLTGAFASTYIRTAQANLVAAGSRINSNHRELSPMLQKGNAGDEEEPVQAGLPPCSATSGNCKLGLGATAYSGLFYAQINRLVAGLFPVQPFNQSGAAGQGKQMAILIHYPVVP